MGIMEILAMLVQLGVQVQAAAALVKKMQEEGRDKATPEEWASLDAAFDAARAKAVAAIGRG